jgi:hypothetical protein
MAAGVAVVLILSSLAAAGPALVPRPEADLLVEAGTWIAFVYDIVLCNVYAGHSVGEVVNGVLASVGTSVCCQKNFNVPFYICTKLVPG